MSNYDLFDIDRVAFIGRTYEEYVRLFDLDDSILRTGPVLDCPAGASSFTAEACKKGFDVKACDILYERPLNLLHEKGKRDIDYIYGEVMKKWHLFRWDHYKDRDGLVSYRNRALELFLEDYQKGFEEGRYIEAQLPSLPFADNAFALVLSSHFLFLYGDRLSLEFHIASLDEMARISRGEIRVYPLTGLDTKPYPYLDRVMEHMVTRGFMTEIVRVPFEFQKGSDRMMRITCNTSSGRGKP